MVGSATTAGGYSDADPANSIADNDCDKHSHPHTYEYGDEYADEHSSPGGHCYSNAGGSTLHLDTVVTDSRA